MDAEKNTSADGESAIVIPLKSEQKPRNQPFEAAYFFLGLAIVLAILGAFFWLFNK